MKNEIDHKQAISPKIINIGVAQKSSIEVFNIHDVIRCQAKSNTAIFHLITGEKIKSSKCLLNYERFLIKYGFERFNRSDIINKSYIEKIAKGTVFMVDGAEIVVSKKNNAIFRRYVKSILELEG